jgi:hypothetical protein
VSDERFDDPAYWASVHAIARDIAWHGYEKRRVRDFPLRLRIMRTLFGLSDDVWKDADFARALFGGSDNAAAIRFNKFKQASTNLDETEASLVACLINYFLDDPARPRARPTPAQLLDISQWIAKAIRQPDRMSAEAVAGDIFAFTRKLTGLIANEAKLDGAAVDAGRQAATHDLLMGVLLRPLDFASWERRLIIQHPRPRFAAGDRSRFGAEQRAGTDPRSWQPVELDIGKPIEYGLPLRLAEPMQAWLVTIRDPWPEIDGMRDPAGTWLWDAGWENVIRWIPSPFPLQAGEEVAAPSTDRNLLLDMPGLFRVFLFVEPLGSPALARAIGREDWASAPDEADYFRLLDELPSLGPQHRLTLYTGSYLVRS